MLTPLLYLFISQTEKNGPDFLGLEVFARSQPC